jgi:hypothetical protein
LGRLTRGDDNPVIAAQLTVDAKTVLNSMKLINPALGADNRFKAIGILHHLAAIVAADQTPETWTLQTETTPPRTSQVRSFGYRFANLGSMEPVEGADRMDVARYNMLTPLQKTIFKALGLGQGPGDVCRGLELPNHVLNAEIAKIGRRLKENSHIRLGSLSRELFGVQVSVHTNHPHTRKDTE